MGLGYALTEDFPTDPETGFPTFSTLRQLGILRAKDVPEIDVELVEVPQPRSPYGIKGVGEIGLVPTAPAVAAALHDLDGEWRATLPMKPACTLTRVFAVTRVLAVVTSRTAEDSGRGNTRVSRGLTSSRA